jgi:hypothetical protein
MLVFPDRAHHHAVLPVALEVGATRGLSDSQSASGRPGLDAGQILELIDGDDG